MGEIVSYVKTLPFNQFMIFIVVLFTMNIIYKIFAGIGLKYSKIADYKEMKFGELISYVDSILTSIEDEIYTDAEKIIKSVNNECVDFKCGMDPVETQKSAFSLLLERALFMIMRSKIKLFIKQNNFYNKTGIHLDDYISMRSTECKLLFKKTMNTKISMFKILDGHIEECFTEKDAEVMFRKIVMKAKEIKEEENKHIAKINDEYSLVKKVLGLFKTKKIKDLL